MFEIKGDVSIGYTKHGITFLIDTEDLDKVRQYCWYESRGYIVSNIENKKIRLHRFILNINDERIVDHKNRDTTDNRKENLRIVTPQQNCMNQGVRRDNTIGVEGVSKSANGKYFARIKKDGRTIHLGTYDTL